MRPTNPPAPIQPDKPGHALIDIHPHSAEAPREVVLIADPLHFPPDLVDRIVKVVTDLLDLMVATNQMRIRFSEQSLGTDFAELGDSKNSDRLIIQPARRNHLRPRILVSLIMRSGKIESELAWTNVNPSTFPPEQVDWLISRMNALLSANPSAKRQFVCSQN